MGEKITLTNKLAREITQTYAVYQKVLANILKPFAELKANVGDIHGAKFKITEIRRRLDVLAVKWSKSAMVEAYKSKRAEVSTIAKKAAIFPTIKKDDPADRRVAALAQKSGEEFIKANASIEKTAAAFLAAYEQAMTGMQSAKMIGQVQAMNPDMAAEMSDKVDYWLARGLDEGSISRKLRQYLEKLVGGDDFIEINGRFYELRAYAEMIARSELHDAYVDATIDECKENDCDLVQLSRHDDPCPICAMLEGRVFSISGEDEEFPSIDEMVEVEVMTKTEMKTMQVDPKAIHPNCEHNFNPVTRNILRAAGEL